MLPKLGMHHSDVRKRVKRIKSTPGGNIEQKERVVDSLINQANIAVPGAGEDIKKEFSNKRITSMNPKTRGNYAINACINKIPCKWCGVKCSECLKKRLYEPEES